MLPELHHVACEVFMLLERMLELFPFYFLGLRMAKRISSLIFRKASNDGRTKRFL